MRARGQAHVLTAFDLGYEIDLARAAVRLGVARSPEAFRHKRGAAEEGAEARRPLRFTRPAAALVLGGFACARELEVALYPYGAISLSYSLPLDVPLEGLVELSVLLYDNAELLSATRAEAQAVFEALGDAVREPFLAPAVEDYVIYALEPLECSVAELETHQRELLARILRAERGPLSLHEVENALDGRIAYGPEELVLVDWFGALLVGKDMEDERRVLELTTVELVELRFLDGRLERRLEQAYELMASTHGALLGLSPRTQEVERDRKSVV